MFSITNKLLAELDVQLNSLEQEYDVILKRAELSFYTCKKSTEALKAIILKENNNSNDIILLKEAQ